MSRDHRPDLKQFVISLVMSDSLPVFIQALSGNTSDKNHFREIVKEYGRSLQEKWGEDRIWVWDSAVYSEKNLGEISECYRWITRVPETLSEAKEVLESADTEKMRSTTLDGYRLFSIEVEYGGKDISNFASCIATRSININNTPTILHWFRSLNPHSNFHKRTNPEHCCR